MFRIMRQKTLEKLADINYQRGRGDGTKELIECIKIFAKDGGGTYYFEPVSVENLTVTGNAFFVDVNIYGMTRVGESVTDARDRVLKEVSEATGISPDDPHFHKF